MSNFKNMIGNIYQWNKQSYEIKDIEVTPMDVIKVTTDKKELLVSEDELLKDFKLVSHSVAKVNHHNELASTSVQIARESNSITSVLLSTIEKIEADRDYCKQADAINKTVSNFINLQKTKISALKLVNQD